MTIPRFGQLARFQERSENEESLIKIESDGVHEYIGLFNQRFCRFVAEFDLCETSILESLNVIPFNEFFVLLFNLIGLSNTDFAFFVMKEMMNKYFDSICLTMTKDIIDYHEAYSDFSNKHQSEFSLLKMPVFSNSTFPIEPESIIDWRIRTCDAAFVLDHKQMKKFRFSRSRENDKIETGFDVFHEVLQLSGGSGRESISTCYRWKSDHCIEIDDSVEVIGELAFSGSHSLTQIIFSTKNNLRQIHGFQCCTSLCRIEIPSSVEKIGECGFSGCRSLNEIIFSSDSHLRDISGFEKCRSLRRIEIPSSVEVIWAAGFERCTSLSEIIFRSDSHLREIDGFDKCRSLERIEMPSSVEKIWGFGFSGCISLTEIVFSPDSHLREIYGFRKCRSLCQIEIPLSVNVIWNCGFNKCRSLRIVIVHAGCRMTTNKGLQNVRPFVVYEGDDVKECRRHVHLGLRGRMIL
jgi:hypothetical protein